MLHQTQLPAVKGHKLKSCLNFQYPTQQFLLFCFQFCLSLIDQIDLFPRNKTPKSLGRILLLVVVPILMMGVVCSPMVAASRLLLAALALVVILPPMVLMLYHLDRNISLHLHLMSISGLENGLGGLMRYLVQKTKTASAFPGLQLKSSHMINNTLAASRRPWV